MTSIYREVQDSPRRSQYHEWSTTLPVIAPKLLWKRGSKLGIELAASGAGNKIHFVIDDLDIPSVVRKEGAGGQSITASELRYAYRNREKLVGKIHFYKDNVETESPWVADPELWGFYNPGASTGGRGAEPSRRQGGIRGFFSSLGKAIRRKT